MKDQIAPWLLEAIARLKKQGSLENGTVMSLGSPWRDNWEVLTGTMPDGSTVTITHVPSKPQECAFRVNFNPNITTIGLE